VTALPDFRLEDHFAQWEFAARYHLTASDAQSLALSELLALAAPADRAAYENVWLGYTETRGAADLREVIASTYERRTAGDVLCFAGAEEGIYTAMRVLLSPEDHVIVVTPNYQAVETLPLAICAARTRAGLDAGHRPGR
jgi:aspartate/methionine/tyrosine aminotransferase